MSLDESEATVAQKESPRPLCQSNTKHATISIHTLRTPQASKNRTAGVVQAENQDGVKDVKGEEGEN